MTRELILVADDDATIRENLAIFLRSEGYDVVEAADGNQAAACLHKQSLSLALIDLKMPGQNGIELLRDNAELVEEIPVVVITAYGGSTYAIEAMKLGAFDYITKPFDLDEILFTVRRALTQRALTVQIRSLVSGSSNATPNLWMAACGANSRNAGRVQADWSCGNDSGTYSDLW